MAGPAQRPPDGAHGPEIVKKSRNSPRKFWSDGPAIAATYVRAAELVSQLGRANELDWQAQQRREQGAIPHARGLEKQAQEAREAAQKALPQVPEKFAEAD